MGKTWTFPDFDQPQCVLFILLKKAKVHLTFLDITQVYCWQNVLSFILLRIFRMFWRSELLFDFLSVGSLSKAVHRVESLDATNLPGLSVFSSCCLVQCYRFVLKNFVISDWNACLCWFSFKVIEANATHTCVHIHMHTQMHIVKLRKLVFIIMVYKN